MLIGPEIMLLTLGVSILTIVCLGYMCLWSNVTQVVLISKNIQDKSYLDNEIENHYVNLPNRN